MIKGMNKFILDTLNLPVVSNITSFSNVIGLSPSLIYVLSQNSEYYYKRKVIPKRDGTLRIVYSPSFSMKLVQRWILEEILYKIPISPYSYAFKKGISNPLTQNASAHKDNVFILKIDLKQFFSSICRERIYYIFSQIGYNPTVANLFSNICTLNDQLPQGAVTSPYLSNLVCIKLDKRISKYCEKRGIVFTRYADDMSFSANDKVQLKSVFNMIKKICKSEGFTINDSKTRFLTPKGRKTVTGVTISNGTVKAPKDMKRMVRAMIHKEIATGNYDNIQEIRGYIAYINSIEGDYQAKIKSYIQSFSSKPVCMYKELVYAFNANKLYKDIPDFKLLTSSDFVEYPETYEYESLNFAERVEFLKKHNLLSGGVYSENEQIENTQEESPF